LNGLGRKIRLKPQYKEEKDGTKMITGFEDSASWVIEGQFEDDLLTGFGRMFSASAATHDIGFYNEDILHGYARLFVDGKYQEGLFNNGLFYREVSDYDLKLPFVAQ
jgi:hypothetical protein